DSYSVDRCTTCHIAIDRADASMETFVAKAETALQTINERRVKSGEKPLVVSLPKEEAEPAHGEHREHPAAPTKAAAVEPGETKVAGETATWPPFDQMPTAQKKTYAKALVNTLNVYLDEAGRANLTVGQPLWAHPRLDLFVSPDSPHPMSKMGCTSC